MASESMSENKGKVCISCGRLSTEYVEFKCPSCMQGAIIRDRICRERHTRYRCPNCGTEGP